MRDTILDVRDLVVRYPITSGKRWPWSPPQMLHAVNGVSFSLARGKTLGIVGESGCGKSTLIRAIAGLIKPSFGDIRLEGALIDYSSRASLAPIRRKIQMIFQDPISSLNPRMTISEIVAEPLHVLMPELDEAERQRRLTDMLERVGIARRNFGRYPHEFSGGQCQRIGIARALICEPELLLCDEPVSALDVSIQAQIVNLLSELQEVMGLSIVFVAHDLGVIQHVSDEVLVMYLGGVMEYAPAGELIGNPRHPYTAALLSAVPVADPSVKLAPQILEGELPSALAPPHGCLFSTRCPKATGKCHESRPVLERFEAKTPVRAAQGVSAREVACFSPL